jgi:hypothetical protein
MGFCVAQYLQTARQFDLRLEFCFRSYRDLDMTWIGQSSNGFALGDIRRNISETLLRDPRRIN